MTVAHSTLNQANFNGSLFGFFNLSHGDDDKSQNEDAKCNHEGRSSVRNLSLCCIADKGPHQDVAANSCGRVKHTTRLNQLVTSVTTTTKNVKHWVNNAVQDTHTETCDESTNEVNAKYET